MLLRKYMHYYDLWLDYMTGFPHTHLDLRWIIWIAGGWDVCKMFVLFVGALLSVQVFDERQLLFS